MNAEKEFDFSKKVWSEKFRLGALTGDELGHIACISLVIGLAYVLFHFLGNMVADTGGRSAFKWMVARWGDKISFGADYSHGYVIPFGSLFAVWFKRNDILSAPRKVEPLGLWVIVGALCLHWVGAKMQQTRVSLMSLVIILWGVPYYLCGWHMAKHLIFACTYLIFCIPLNFLDTLAFPLRMLSAKAATVFLNGIGMIAIRDGSAIYVGEDAIPLDVADPCSGLRSLLAMTAITALYAFATQKGLIRQWLLFGASIPLAVFGNLARIATIAIMSEAVGRDFALGLYHDYSGYIMFTAAISLMFAFGMLLSKDYGEIFRKCKSALTNRTS